MQTDSKEKWDDFTIISEQNQIQQVEIECITTPNSDEKIV